MTSVGELSHRPADVVTSARPAPVIVMAYSGSGAERLRPVLSAFPGLTCTTGTGIVPLCHNAVTAWQAADGGAGEGLSTLAAASVRSLSAGLVTAILLRDGGKRWCEFTTAPPMVAETFARLYPHTRFMTVHCRADTVIRAIIDASRWGLAGPEFAPFVSANPASSVAALASFWVAHTTEQLKFEQAHPESCRRVRIEELRANSEQAMLDIGDFLSLRAESVSPWLIEDEGGSQAADANPLPERIPLAQIPAPLLAQLNELHRELGYQPLTH